MAIICTWWNYFDMIRNPSSNTLLRLTKLFIDSQLKAAIRTKVRLGLIKKMQMLK